MSHVRRLIRRVLTFLFGVEITRRLTFGRTRLELEEALFFLATAGVHDRGPVWRRRAGDDDATR